VISSCHFLVLREKFWLFIRCIVTASFFKFWLNFNENFTPANSITILMKHSIMFKDAFWFLEAVITTFLHIPTKICIDS
jgi:hypothetical protein